MRAAWCAGKGSHNLPRVTVNGKHRITLPDEVLEALGITSGDTLQVRVEGATMLITPEKPDPAGRLRSPAQALVDGREPAKLCRRRAGRVEGLIATHSVVGIDTPVFLHQFEDVAPHTRLTELDNGRTALVTNDLRLKPVQELDVIVLNGMLNGDPNAG